MSRNQYVRRALEKAIAEETEGSDRFLDALNEAARDIDSHKTVREMMKAISARRSRKRPPRL